MMDIFQKGWQQFIRWCHKSRDEENLSTLFDLLLTPEEKKDISMRCLIIRELILQEQSQRDIAKHLNVSIAKITRGSNELKRINSDIIQYVKSNLLK